MPIIHKPADAIRELVHLRTLHGKVFDLGGNKRRIIQKIGRVHYVDSAGQLQDIELEAVRDSAGDVVAHESLPYTFRLHRSGVGFDYRSKSDASEISLQLDRIGIREFERSRQYNVACEGRFITFTDVDSGLDIVFALTRFGVRTYRKLKSESAARSWRWQIECNELGEAKLHKSTIAGEDAEGRGVDVIAKLGTAELLGNGWRRYFSEESWSGKVAKRDFKTRVKSWSDEVSYPVWIDPDITENIVADADDGHEWHQVSWASSTPLDEFGNNIFYRHPAWRFQGVALPAAADLTSIDLAVLKINAISSTLSGGGGTLYGYDVDDAAALSDTVKPTTMAKTTASTAVAPSTSTGVRSYTITTIVDEWAQRAGRVSGNDFTVFGIGTTTEVFSRTSFEDYSYGGTDEAQLEIDYTEAGGGGGGTAGARRRRTLICGSTA